MNNSHGLIEVKSENRFGLEYFVVLVNGVEHASFWSPQKAESVANRLHARSFVAHNTCSEPLFIFVAVLSLIDTFYFYFRHFLILHSLFLL